jgi:hypothetical protein
MEQSKLMQFVDRSNNGLRKLYEDHPNATKFGRLAFNDSAVQERMMRVGIEARALNVSSEDGVFELAVATLQDDHVKHERSRLGCRPDIQRSGGRMKHTYMTVTQHDGSVWGVPIAMIATNRAIHYAREFGGDVHRSLAEDTAPLFEADDYEIKDWAVNNMNWSDFDGYQVKLKDATPPDFQEAWMSGDKGLA